MAALVDPCTVAKARLSLGRLVAALLNSDRRLEAYRANAVS